jgi:hypothetical protein
VFGHGSRQSPDDEPGRFADALARLPMPESPASRLWEFSAKAFLRPYLPAPLRRAPTALDRLGALRLGPTAIGLDTQGDVPWTDVLEVRTRSLFDVLSDGFVEDLRRRSAELLPPLPGMGKASAWAADKMAELTLSVFLLALPDAPERVAPDVPAEIVRRNSRGRPERMVPGMLSTAILALPAVSDSVLSTARANGIAAVSSGPSAITAAAGARSAALAERRSMLVAQLARLRRAEARGEV